MAKSARVIAERTLADGRFRLTRTKVEVDEADGARRGLDYEIYHHGPAAAVLLYDAERRVVMLVRQFRLAAYLADGTLAMLEACAGMLDGDAPEACARREALEETGVRVAAMRHAFDAFSSPGALTEKISLFRRALPRRRSGWRRRRRRRRRAHRGGRDRICGRRSADRLGRHSRRQDDRPRLLREGDRAVRLDWPQS